MGSFTVASIGVVRSTRTEVMDDRWDSETSRIELDPEHFIEESIAGLDTFSHVEVIYLFDRVTADKIERGARRPRNNPEWPRVGIFAQRGKNRPNRIGSTVCRVAKVDGLVLHVEGLDAIDGTPVLDLKPWVVELGPRGDVKQPAWMTELMRGYWS
jgi:tRNA (adenine37-N6)-methyltransferase